MKKCALPPHTSMADQTKEAHTTRAAGRALDALRTFSCRLSQRLRVHSLRKGEGKKKSLLKKKNSFTLNPVPHNSILVQSIFRQAFKYSIKTDPSSNNVESREVIANISVLSLHQSHYGAVVPPSFLSNSGTCNHGNIHRSLSSRTELTITITAQNTWGGGKGKREKKKREKKRRGTSR